MKEMQENFQVLLQKRPYEEHWWSMCADVEVIAILCCKADTLNSTAFDVNGTGEEATVLRLKKWPLRSETTLGQKNAAHSALRGKAIIYLPSCISSSVWSKYL